MKRSRDQREGQTGDGRKDHRDQRSRGRRQSGERRESRGSHYRVDYLQRNDEKFLKTTIASYNEATGEADISFEETEYGVVTPRIRDYSTTKKQKKDAAEPAGGTDRTSGAAAETPAAVGGKA